MIFYRVEQLMPITPKALQSRYTCKVFNLVKALMAYLADGFYKKYYNTHFPEKGFIVGSSPFNRLNL